MSGETHQKEHLQIPSRCNFPQNCQSTVDLIPKSWGKLQNRLLRDVNLWNVWCRSIEGKKIYQSTIPQPQTTQCPINKPSNKKLQHLSINNKSNLLVNESASIAPQKQSSQSNHQTMTEQGEQMVFYYLKENPDSCCPAKKSCRNLLVPPQEHISSYTTKTITHMNSDSIQ